ncbi:MAG: hypothetical protein RL112_149 [Planctomycetota bacterium]|jgi:hypothetical protein
MKDDLPLHRRIAEFFRRLFAAKSRRYLCDDCKWDYGAACKRRERPNALVCPDYKRR